MAPAILEDHYHTPYFGHHSTEIKFTDQGLLLNFCKAWVRVLNPGISSQDAILSPHLHTWDRCV